MADADVRDQISRIEADIEELAKTLEGCRKAILLSKVAIAVGGVWVLAALFGAVRFDAAATTGAIAAVIGGHRRFRIKSNYVEANYDSNKSRRDTQSRVDRHDQSSNCRRDRGRPLSAWLVNIVLGYINRLIY